MPAARPGRSAGPGAPIGSSDSPRSARRACDAAAPGRGRRARACRTAWPGSRRRRSRARAPCRARSCVPRRSGSASRCPRAAPPASAPSRRRRQHEIDDRDVVLLVAQLPETLVAVLGNARRRTRRVAGAPRWHARSRRRPRPRARSATAEACHAHRSAVPRRRAVIYTGASRGRATRARDAW